MQKPASLVVTYYVSNEIDISKVEKDLKISWEDVEDYTVKYNQLTIWMKDGAEMVYEPDSYPEGDYKHPVHVHEYDVDGEQLN